MLSLLKNKKKSILFMFMFVIALALTSCASGTTGSSTSTSTNSKEVVTDMMGREVEVTKGSYNRVVCIGAGALRLYSYIGDVNKLAGVEDIDNESLTARPKMFDGVARPYFIAYKDVFKTKRSCGVGGPQSQVAEEEKILSCNPDIIVSEYEDVEKANKLQGDLNVPVIVVKYGSDGVFDTKLKQSLELLGKVFDNTAKAKRINDFIESEKTAISNRTKDITVASQKKVYICGLGNWGTTNHLMTCQNYAPFNVAHINNVVSGLATNAVNAIDKEKFEELAPNMDVMILDAAAIKNIKGLYQENPSMFNNCKAWVNNEVYLQMAYNAYYTNIEIALCNTWFNAKVVYPSLFSDIDINTKLNEITNVFLGKELANDIMNYPMSYGGYGKVNKETIFA